MTIKCCLISIFGAIKHHMLNHGLYWVHKTPIKRLPFSSKTNSVARDFFNEQSTSLAMDHWKKLYLYLIISIIISRTIHVMYNKYYLMNFKSDFSCFQLRMEKLTTGSALISFAVYNVRPIRNTSRYIWHKNSYRWDLNWTFWVEFKKDKK